jgi:hypothetical protein
VRFVFTCGLFACGAIFPPPVSVLFLPAAYFARGAFFSPAVRVLFFTCGLLPAELFFHVRKHLAKEKNTPGGTTRLWRFLFACGAIFSTCGGRFVLTCGAFYLPAAGTLSLITL